MTHKLIVIGYVGIKRAYLDMSLDEAIDRYKEDEARVSLTDEDIKEFEFEDSFGVYDAWE